ncbi:lipopolysaccharide transport periplasmic protein LptA [Meinhardsimonia xiamenensis]|nr:lipopolysaccharide transport periplasmic protein LptA [Meinhardsimonia xiamenensis]
MRRLCLLMMLGTAMAATLFLPPASPALAQGDGTITADPPAQGGAAMDLGRQDSGLPIEITSEKLRLDREANTALFEVNVIARQGSMTLKADRLLVEYTTNEEGGYTEVRRLTADGNVVLIQAKPDQPGAKPDIAEGDHAVYELATETIVMTGNVLVAQNDTVVTGDRLTYRLDTGQGLMEGNVNTLLVPKQSQ